MIKLVLLSDLTDEENKEIDRRLLSLFDDVNPSIGYIPSCSDLNGKYFKKILEYYNKLGIAKVDYFDLDLEYDEQTFTNIFNYDAIHLSGGNTFYFLNLLKKRDLVETVRKYVNNGGILIGVSAGSILTTKTIEIAGYGEDVDQNNVCIDDLNALGLVDFEFMPHWDGSEEIVNSLRNYARAKNTIVYACKDGDGIVIDNSKIELIGDIRIIE
ncbi:Type 1 glutamine amidotransferase-like domain-containing protein [Paenibacillus apii]|uniref:Type 1 glutamine amidotransferase-like domain-containing protein n=1 Tax=Paenibacillus apii TaxID=1850370 RepID=UPI00143A57E8|nr:Type 1 glutamine amidotransferase-like domain-containing protein [Paenibacillus apii]NJJ42448.1 type 1 glutamine amidotransferase-like domain-containing protein [Paenibacillus apii]